MAGCVAEFVCEFQKWFMAFGQADEFTEPVDHLDIDVDVVVAVPRGFVFLVPDAL